MLLVHLMLNIVIIRIDKHILLMFVLLDLILVKVHLYEIYLTQLLFKWIDQKAFILHELA